MLKREPYSVYYVLDSTTSPDFQLKYKHVIFSNPGGSIMTIYAGTRILTVVEPNSVKELFDLFTSKDVEEGHSGIKCRIVATGANTTLYVDNFGV